MINLENSFIHFTGPKNSWRTNIKSVLKIEDKTYYLVKECRAERVAEHPFYPQDQGDKYYELFAILQGIDTTDVRGGKTYFIKTSVIDDNTGFHQNGIPYTFNQLKNKKHIVESNVNYLSFEKVNEIVSSGKTNNIYCVIEYEYEGIKYSLITKCEYINYNTEKNGDKYLQPIMGYVPFILKNQLRYGYVVLNVNEKKNGCLEFLLNEKTAIFNINLKKNLIKFFIKKILNILLFFMKKNDFTELICIKESKINFLSYD